MMRLFWGVVCAGGLCKGSGWADFIVVCRLILTLQQRTSNLTSLDHGFIDPDFLVADIRPLRPPSRINKTINFTVGYK